MQPVLTRLSRTRYAFDGPFAAYLRAVTEQWLLIAPQTPFSRENPLRSGW